MEEEDPGCGAPRAAYVPGYHIEVTERGRSHTPSRSVSPHPPRLERVSFAGGTHSHPRIPWCMAAATSLVNETAGRHLVLLRLLIFNCEGLRVLIALKTRVLKGGKPPFKVLHYVFNPAPLISRRGGATFSSSA